MGMVVRTNTMSTNAYRQLGMNNSAVSKSLEKLSSGFRINRAGDDASGLAISEKMKAQINGLEQASSNSQDGISLIQTAEGATTEIHNMLNRMVTLATKSSSGTIQNEVDRDAIQTEVDALNTEITRIAKSTNFNGINLLDGNLGGEVSSLTGGAKFEDTKATLGVSKTDAFVAQGTGAALQANDTITYTVNWSDKDGKAQETKLTFTAKSATELVGDSGTSHTVTTTKITPDEFTDAIMKELQANKDFNDAFTITRQNTDTTLQFESKTLGADGGKVTGTSLTSSKANTAPTGGVAIASNTAGIDAGKKLTLSTVKVAQTGQSKEDMQKNIFTIDGKKFLAVANNVTTLEMATLDKDVNVIAMGDTEATIGGTNAATELANIAAKINQVTGSKEFTSAAAAAASADAGIDEGDIIYTPTNKGLSLQVGDTNADFNHVTVSVDDLTAKGIGTEGLDVSSQKAAGDAIDTIRSAINKVSTNRGNLGALQNRLEYTINNLDTTNENMTSANSRIRDTDMAKEMMNYTKMNILTQAAQSMLAQANQQPQQILQLLQ